MTHQKTFRFSAEREAILEVLCSTKSHPTAEWIFQKLEEKEISISLATIYRNLDILCQQNRAKKLEIQGEKHAHFDGMMEDHSHFICKKHNKIHDIPRFKTPLACSEQYLTCNKCVSHEEYEKQCPIK